MHVYVVTYAIDFEGIQHIEAVWDTEEAAKAHVAQLSEDAYANEFFEYEKCIVKSATLATAEPGTASANE